MVGEIEFVFYVEENVRICSKIVLQQICFLSIKIDSFIQEYTRFMLHNQPRDMSEQGHDPIAKLTTSHCRKNT